MQEGADQEVPEVLLKLAMQSSHFRKSRFRQGKGRGGGGGGKSFKPRERPGLGLTGGNAVTLASSVSDHYCTVIL